MSQTESLTSKEIGWWLRDAATILRANGSDTHAAEVERAADLLEHPLEATGLQCEKDGVCALVSRNDDEWHCTACNGDFVRKQPVEPKQSEATEIPTVRRWNAKYPGISMLEHNGELVRSGFGPYVLAEDYDRLSRTLAAIEKARAIERKARQRLQTELLALCTEHVGGELDPDNANPAGNSHHE